MEILRLVWYPANQAKLRRHGVARYEVDGMIVRNAWVIGRHVDYPDQIRVTGPATGGRLITVALAPEAVEGHWRPVTGWEASPEEIDYYREEYR